MGHHGHCQQYTGYNLIYALYKVLTPSLKWLCVSFHSKYNGIVSDLDIDVYMSVITKNRT